MPKTRIKNSIDLQFPKFDERIKYTSATIDFDGLKSIIVRIHGVPEKQLRELARVTGNKVSKLSTCFVVHINVAHNVRFVFFT